MLVGNGFDLAHGLPTTYKNFLDFVRFLTNQSEQQEEKIHSELRGLFKNPVPELTEMVRLTEKNIWIQYFLKIDFALQDEWIDFEREMYRVIRILDNIPSTGNDRELYNQFGKPLSPLLYVLQAYGFSDVNSIRTLYPQLTAVRDRLLSDLTDLTRCLEIYLGLCIEYIEVTKRLRLFDETGNLEDEPIEGVLSFNYTNTFEKIYQPVMISDPEYCYVHGKAQAENSVELNNMVLGIDEYLDKEKRDTNTTFVAFKKYYQRIFKQTDHNYSDWLFEPETKLFVIGHSLSATDKGVLRNLILHKGVQTKIYYHNREANAEQICHLLNVIGYENLNNLSRGNDESRSITFSQLL